MLWASAWYTGLLELETSLLSMPDTARLTDTSTV